MASISFTIPDDKLPRIIDAMKGLHPIPQINTGTEQDPVWEPEFSDAQWAKESVRRWIRDQVARWEQRAAIDAIAFSPEDDIVV